MKKALIDANTHIDDGLRVCQVETNTFEVALPLFWVDCPDDIIADAYVYIQETNTFKIFNPINFEELEVADSVIY